MDEVNHAPQRIAMGTGMVFAGKIISMFFWFLSRAIIARFFSRAEYGVFSLALTILSVALVIATMGFPGSLSSDLVYKSLFERKEMKSIFQPVFSSSHSLYSLKTSSGTGLITCRSFTLFLIVLSTV